MIVAVGNNEQYKAVCDMLGRQDLKTDPRYSTNTLRVKHRDELYAELDKSFSTQTKKHWLKLLHERKVSAAEINNLKEVFEEPQIQHRQMRIEMANHPLNKRVELLGNPIKMSETPVSYEKPPPLLGEHTSKVLKQKLNLSDELIQQLANDNII